ncbi:MAG: mercuric transporter MerT family protein [Acetobacteraceae bacterium]|nr:mercuric transporter MerT family protein [Acetobacteraceae bacterium]
MPSTETNYPLDRQQLRDTGATLLTLGGLAAAFGVASCCGLPFLLATLGLSSAWLGGIALLAAPHRPLLLWAAAICLVTGCALLWRRRAAAGCTSETVCSKPAVRNLTVVGLLAGLALLTIGYLYA